MTDQDAIARAAADGDQAALAEYLKTVRAIFGRDAAFGPHLGRHLDIEVLDVSVDRVVMRMAHRQELVRAGGIFHGGAIMALADHAAGCLFTCDPRVFVEQVTGLTTDFHTSFLRGAPPGAALIAEATMLRRGRTATFMEVDVRAEGSEKLVASVRTTYVSVPWSKVGK